MTKTICDKCGKDIPTCSGSSARSTSLHVWEPYSDRNGPVEGSFSGRYLEICSECRKPLSKLLLEWIADRPPVTI